MAFDQDEKAAILTAFEKGRRLHEVRRQEGWEDVLTILEDQVFQAEYRLINLPSGASPELLRDLHTHARASRTVFEQLQIQMNDLIRDGATLPPFDPDAHEAQFSGL